jgi:hypothetical protein
VSSNLTLSVSFQIFFAIEDNLLALLTPNLLHWE